jgi:hypothetical protein
MQPGTQHRSLEIAHGISQVKPWRPIELSGLVPLSPENRGRVAVDFAEEVFDMGTGGDQVVKVEAKVSLAGLRIIAGCGHPGFTGSDPTSWSKTGNGKGLGERGIAAEEDLDFESRIARCGIRQTGLCCQWAPTTSSGIEEAYL